MSGVVAASSRPAAPTTSPDGIALRVDHGATTGSVDLGWTGGPPNFGVYRAASPVAVTDPANQIGFTGFTSWADTPPDGVLYCYVIVSSCAPTPVELCDGLDNDCDGAVDEPGSEASCPLPNAVPACVGGACAIAGCNSGFSDCDTNPQNGCETDLGTVANCGGCGISCNDGNTCTADMCNATHSCGHVNVAACAVAACASTCSVPDTDGDGLNDAWEQNGYIDLNCNGVQDGGDPTLPDSNPDLPNIYVKYDFMVVPSSDTPCVTSADCAPPGQQCIANRCTGHSHAPSAAAIALTSDAFQAHNVILRFYPVSEAIPETRVVAFPPISPICSGPGAANFFDVKNANFPTSLKHAYHYALFAHFNTCDGAPSCAVCPPDPSTGTAPIFGLTGIAERPGNDFIVSFGAYVDSSTPILDNHLGGTFMHELGHNLGLGHGGEDELLQKPNYFSVMNYSYQFGIGTSPVPGPYPTTPDNPAVAYRIDYSRSALGPLNECGVGGLFGGLDETTGIPGGDPFSRDIAIFFHDAGPVGPPQTLYAPSNGTPIDWNANGLPFDLHVVTDVNGDGQCSLLQSYDDWSNLDYAFQCTANFLDAGPVQSGCGPPPAVAEPR